MSPEHSSEEGSATKMPSTPKSEEDSPGSVFFPPNLTARETYAEINWLNPGPVPREVFDELKETVVGYKRTIEELKTEKAGLQEKIQSLEIALGSLQAAIAKSRINQDPKQPKFPTQNDSAPKKAGEVIVGIILARAEIALLGKEWAFMEAHCERALRYAMPVNSGPLTAHCEFYQAIALFGQQKWQAARRIFMQSSPCIGVYKTPQEWNAWRDKIGDITQETPIYSAHNYIAKSNALVNQSPSSILGWENLGDVAAIHSATETPDCESEISSFNSPMPTPRPFPVENPRVSNSDIISARPEELSKSMGLAPGVSQEPKPVLKILLPSSSYLMASRQSTSSPMPDASKFNVAHPKATDQTIRSGYLSDLDCDLEYPAVLSDELSEPDDLKHPTMLSDELSELDCFGMIEEGPSSPLERSTEDGPWESDPNPTTLPGSLDRSAMRFPMDIPWGYDSDLAMLDSVRSNGDMLSNSGSKADSDSTETQSYVLGNLTRLYKRFSLSGTNSASGSSSAPPPPKSPISPQNPSPPAETSQSFSPALFNASDTLASSGPSTHPVHVAIQERARPNPSRSFPPVLGKFTSDLGTPSLKDSQGPLSPSPPPLTVDALLQLDKELGIFSGVALAETKPKIRGAKSAAVRSMGAGVLGGDSGAEARRHARKAVSEYWGKVDSQSRIEGVTSLSFGREIDVGVWDVKDGGKDGEGKEEEEKPSGILWKTLSVAGAFIAGPFRKRALVTEEDW